MTNKTTINAERIPTKRTRCPHCNGYLETKKDIGTREAYVQCAQCGRYPEATVEKFTHVSPEPIPHQDPPGHSQYYAEEQHQPMAEPEKPQPIATPKRAKPSKPSKPQQRKAAVAEKVDTKPVQRSTRMNTIGEAVQLMREGRLYSETWQRDWAWTKRQIAELMDSTFRNYKIGSTLFWRRNLSDGDFRTVILDGQQRMTTFYTAFYNEVPPIFDRYSPLPPLDLHFNVKTTAFKFPSNSEKERPYMVLVSDIMQNTRALDDMEKHVRPNCTTGEWRLITQNIRRVQNIMDQLLNVEELSPSTAIEDVKRQVERLNRNGKTPSKEDIELIQLSFVWPECHEAVNHLTYRWKNTELEPAVNKANIIRNFAATMTGAVRSKTTKQAFETADATTIKQAYAEIACNLEILGHTLNHYLDIGKSISLRTAVPFVVLTHYLKKCQGQFPDQVAEMRALAYLITATLRGFRAGSSSTYLNQDMEALENLENPEPWDKLEQLAVWRNGPTLMEPSRFEYRHGSPSQNHLIVQVLQMLPSSRDWLTGQPLREYDKNDLVNHNIFPHKEIPDAYDYKSIANTVLLTKSTAKQLQGQSPSQYLPIIAKQDHTMLAGQQIPANAVLYQPENFEHFAQARRELLTVNSIDLIKQLQNGIPPAGLEQRPTTVANPLDTPEYQELLTKNSISQKDKSKVVSDVDRDQKMAIA